MKIPSDRLHYMSVVVRDLRAAAEKMARVYGITDWQVVNNGPDHLTEQASYGFKTPSDFKTAVGSAQTPDGPLTFQLVQPGEGLSTYKTWLATRGEGVMAVCMAEIAPQQLAELIPWLKEQGIEIAQSYRVDGVVYHVQLDTREALGGFFTELLVAQDPAWREKLKIDERWDLAAFVPPGGPLMAPTTFRHFGVVVHDLMKVIQNWNRLFEATQFRVMNWRTAPDSLVEPFYNGVAGSGPVNHEYFTSTPNIGHFLSFELIQPTFGPSHYKEDFLQPLGEGVHHLHTGTTTGEDAWREIEKRMAQAGAPLCMGGGLGEDIAHFYYVDTRKALPGYVTEYTHPGRNAPKPGQGSPFKPLMMLDLSEHA
jgi:hypothetical protein